MDKKEEKEEEERVVRLELWARNTISRKGEKKKGGKGESVCVWLLSAFFPSFFSSRAGNPFTFASEKERGKRKAISLVRCLRWGVGEVV